MREMVVNARGRSREGEKEGDSPNTTREKSPAGTMRLVARVVEQGSRGACQVNQVVLGSSGEAHRVGTNALVARS